MSSISKTPSRAPQKRATSSRASALSLADRAIWNGVRSVRRMEILESIRANGPLTVPELSELYNQESTGLYYHIKLLQQAGLIYSVGKDGRESFAVRNETLRVKCNLKNAKESKRLRKLVEVFAAKSQETFAADSAVTGSSQLLRALRWENLEAREVAKIKALQQQIENILDIAKTRRVRAKKTSQTVANWHVGSFIQPARADQFPVTSIECVTMG
ncbi:MAG: helix-turn-helix domain-containing protein [Planctomycetota bacterium]|nr:helix-turn-helix domain-containing protein [Planctomycetota bacterium]